MKLKKTFIRKNTQECLKDNPVLIDNNIIVIKDNIRYVVKIDEKGECVYYEANVSNL